MKTERWRCDGKDQMDDARNPSILFKDEEEDNGWREIDIEAERKNSLPPAARYSFIKSFTPILHWGSCIDCVSCVCVCACRSTPWTTPMRSTVSTAPTRPSWRTRWWSGWPSRSPRSAPPSRSTPPSDTEGEGQGALQSQRLGGRLRQRGLKKIRCIQHSDAHSDIQQELCIDHF